MFCLPNHLATEFKTKLKNGEITPDKLIKMTSGERNAFFGEFMGKVNAKEVNASFESKLLLKNQQQGIITWAKTVAGIKPEVKRDLLSKVEKMTEILQPKELDSFLGDLAEKRLGMDVSAEEAGKIVDLSKSISDAESTMKSSPRRSIGQPPTVEELAYGKAKVDFYNYVNELKVESGKLPIGEKLKHPLDTAIEIGGMSKAMKSSMDNSAIFRQGWKTLMTDPKIWLNNAIDTFHNISKTIGGKAVMNEVNADIVSRPTYSLMQKAKLAVGTVEESFPTSWPEKIPALGRLYKASQDAFTAFVHKTRADVFDKYIDIARKSGVDVTDKFELESIGKLVNSLTGRGSLGKIEPIANIVNNVFFSIRLLKSHIDTLTLHGTEKMSWFARKKAATNLLKMISGASAILAIANAVNPDSVEEDPRSADFGKIKVGDTRFDVTGGLSGLITLVSRVATKSSKSSISGVVTPTDSGKYGAMTTGDVIVNFFSNKLSPASSFVKDILTGTTFEGEKPTLLGELKNLFVPLPVTNYQEVRDNPKSANTIAVLIADALGIGTNTYSRKLSEAEKLDEELSNLPPEEAGQRVTELYDKNPELYDKLMKVIDEKELGITAKDKYVKTLGISNGERAQYIFDELSKLNPQEKADYWQELSDKSIITDKVNQQLSELESPAQKGENGMNTEGIPDSDLNKNETIGELKYKAKGVTDEKSMIDVAKLYAEAAVVDPLTAIQTLFTKEQLKDVRGGAIIMERLVQGIDPNSKLDHRVPLELGGDNADSNLQVISTEQWKANTPVENYLGKLLNDGKIGEKRAGLTILMYKNGEITFDEIKEKYGEL